MEEFQQLEELCIYLIEQEEDPAGLQDLINKLPLHAAKLMQCYDRYINTEGYDGLDQLIYYLWQYNNDHIRQRITSDINEAIGCGYQLDKMQLYLLNLEKNLH